MDYNLFIYKIQLEIRTIVYFHMRAIDKKRDCLNNPFIIFIEKSLIIVAHFLTYFEMTGCFTSR